MPRSALSRYDVIPRGSPTQPRPFSGPPFPFMDLPLFRDSRVCSHWLPRLGSSLHRPRSHVFNARLFYFKLWTSRLLFSLYPASPLLFLRSEDHILGSSFLIWVFSADSSPLSGVVAKLYLKTDCSSYKNQDRLAPAFPLSSPSSKVSFPSCLRRFYRPTPLSLSRSRIRRRIHRAVPLVVFLSPLRRRYPV